ncbi:hypothetical protein GGR55DRAFT_665116 [Xylaria sp. FL0064]|nr:hypothetical protein GGR55DRAFT_665116 [Xylaria sp. FL0064]
MERTLLILIISLAFLSFNILSLTFLFFLPFACLVVIVFAPVYLRLGLGFYICTRGSTD